MLGEIEMADKKSARAVLDFMRDSKLVNLEVPVSSVVSSVSQIADDVDGNLICWQAYVLIHRPGLGGLGEEFEAEG
jgi:hypothetical protein